MLGGGFSFRLCGAGVQGFEGRQTRNSRHETPNTSPRESSDHRDKPDSTREDRIAPTRYSCHSSSQVAAMAATPVVVKQLLGQLITVVTGITPEVHFRWESRSNYAADVCFLERPRELRDLSGTLLRNAACDYYSYKGRAELRWLNRHMHSAASRITPMCEQIHLRSTGG